MAHKTEQNKIIILHAEKRWWKRQKASASIVVENREIFPFLIFLYVFSRFRLLFLAFRVKGKFHDFIVVFNAPNARWSTDVIIEMQSDFHLFLLIALRRFAVIKTLSWGKWMAPLSSSDYVTLVMFYVHDLIVYLTMLEHLKIFVFISKVSFGNWRKTSLSNDLKHVLLLFLETQVSLILLSHPFTPTRNRFHSIKS